MLRTAPIFADYMVLQQKKNLYVWGSASPWECISITIQGKRSTAFADENGHWMAAVAPLEMSFEEKMVISGKKEEICINNVAVGEVWVAAGQSNMEFYMRYDQDFEKEHLNCHNENIRFFDVPRISYESQMEEEDYSRFGFWRVCDEENLEYYSAVAYYFAKELQNSYHIPIGIVGCNWGGTSACCWMDYKSAVLSGKIWVDEYVEALKKCGNYQAYIDKEKKGNAIWKNDPFKDPLTERLMYGVSPEETRKILKKMAESGMFDAPVTPVHPWRPCGLYRTMLKKIVPYSVQGILWYQGESDAGHAEIYDSVLTRLIQCWRGEWREELPFIMAHVAPYSDGRRFGEIRRAQEQVAECINKVYTVATGDVGMKYDLHPKKKGPVGYRMSLIARHYIYGEDLLCEAPVPEKWSVFENRVTISMKNAGKGLVMEGESLTALKIFDKANVCLSETAYSVRIEKNRLSIDLKQGSFQEGMKINFAMEDFFQVNLFNSAHIPAKPFSYVIEGDDKK
ncbi:sialate O-acetylesterase [Catenibacillus scindens]|uniref:Sialate O-acetylesterase n=1 Tax=Catenibacillus scindens TaxID=673271 RepID=A0A7W8HBX7_9FIRM|nr:sialate O-acetylesterase [Catenibacillus scindens]MBB5265656.1 sialate O-acetylesterase [Catenibacillus scindens]